MPSSRSIPARESSLPIRTRPGSDPRMKTRMGCYASTSRREQTCPGGHLRIWKPSPSRSTTGPARSLAGRVPPRCSRNSYARFNSPVLHRRVELAQYASAQITTFAAENGITRSMGSTGICWDNAMAESFFATLKTEFYYRRVWPTQAGAKLAVGAWIEDRYNRRRRHSSIGQISPVAFEMQHCNQTAADQQAA